MTKLFESEVQEFWIQTWTNLASMCTHLEQRLPGEIAFDKLGPSNIAIRGASGMPIVLNVEQRIISIGTVNGQLNFPAGEFLGRLVFEDPRIANGYLNPYGLARVIMEMAVKGL